MEKLSIQRWPDSQICIGCPNGCFIQGDDERIGDSAYLCFVEECTYEEPKEEIFEPPTLRYRDDGGTEQ